MQDTVCNNKSKNNKKSNNKSKNNKIAIIRVLAIIYNESIYVPLPYSIHWCLKWARVGQNTSPYQYLVYLRVSGTLTSKTEAEEAK